MIIYYPLCGAFAIMGIFAIIHACVSWSHFVFFIATQHWQELKRNYPTLNSGVIILTPTPPRLREPATAAAATFRPGPAAPPHTASPSAHFFYAAFCIFWCECIFFGFNHIVFCNFWCDCIFSS